MVLAICGEGRLQACTVSGGRRWRRLCPQASCRCMWQVTRATSRCRWCASLSVRALLREAKPGSWRLVVVAMPLWQKRGAAARPGLGGATAPGGAGCGNVKGVAGAWGADDGLALGVAQLPAVSGEGSFGWARLGPAVALCGPGITFSLMQACLPATSSQL